MSALTYAQRVQLEDMMDHCTVPAVLDAIADICAEKAEYIRARYDDEPLACAWESCGRAVYWSTRDSRECLP